jgi:hypothetical protein
MPDYRCNHQYLTPSTTQPFQTHWEYATILPLADCLHDKFFIGAWSNLRPGDLVHFCRYQDRLPTQDRDTVLLEVAAARVIASTREAVPLFIVSPVQSIGVPVMPKAHVVEPRPPGFIDGDGRAEWKGPVRKWCVFVEDREVANGIDSRDTAQAMARGDIPLAQPEKAA